MIKYTTPFLFFLLLICAMTACKKDDLNPIKNKQQSSNDTAPSDSSVISTDDDWKGLKDEGNSKFSVGK